MLNGNGSGADESTMAHDQVHAGGFISSDMDLDKVFNHRLFASQHSLHVRPNRAGLQSKRSPTCGERFHLGAMDDVLTWKTGNVRAGAADKLPFDNGGAQASRSHRPRQILAGFSAAKNENVVAVGLGHVTPRFQV